jgi:hypothetical protein
LIVRAYVLNSEQLLHRQKACPCLPCYGGQWRKRTRKTLGKGKGAGQEAGAGQVPPGLEDLQSSKPAPSCPLLGQVQTQSPGLCPFLIKRVEGST